MKATQLSNLTLSAWCESLALLLGGGVSCEEALLLLCDGDENTATEASKAVHGAYRYSLHEAMAQTQLFPAYMLHMVQAGEDAGRLEEVLLGLASFYETADMAEKKVKSAVLYPMILLAVMGALLLFIVLKILPVFSGVYSTLAGEMAAQSYGYIWFSYAAGWFIFVLTALAAAGMVTLWLLWKTPRGKPRVLAVLQTLPALARCISELELAKFTAVFSTYIASATDTDLAFAAACAAVSDSTLQKKLQLCKQKLASGVSFSRAAYEAQVYQPVYGRMLLSSSCAGRFDEGLRELSIRQWALAQEHIDRVTQVVEPSLAAAIACSVGILLISIMLPLIGIMNSIA